MRRARSAALARSCVQLAADHLEEGDVAVAWYIFFKAIQWQQISMMEGWGQRDNSLGRFGTRFAREARTHDAGDIETTFDELANLDAASVTSRLAAAPAWAHERNDRSWRSRRAIGEPVTRLESDRDVLRVCTIYGLRAVEGPPYPRWHAIPERADIQQRLNRLRDTLGQLQA